MNSKSANTGSEQARSAYLANLRALSREIASAISAVEQNDLARFQSNVAAQEMICGELSQPQGSISPLNGADRAADWSEIRDAHLQLSRLNRVYAALLKRSYHSNALLAALYRNYGQGYGQTSTAPAETHTWSCEG